MFCFYNVLSVVKLDNQFITHVLAFNALINFRRAFKIQDHIISNIILK